MNKIINTIYISTRLVLLTVIISLSSCGAGYQVSNCPGLAMKKCCEKTANEVYKYEGEYINENK